MPKSRKKTMTADRKQQLSDKVREAMKNPGVAEAMEVYQNWARINQIYDAHTEASVVVNRTLSSSTQE